MTESLSTTRQIPQRPSGAERWIPLAIVWQGLVGVAGLALAGLLIRDGGAAGGGIVRPVLALILVAGGLACLLSIPLLQRRRHLGRLVAVVVNYLAFLAAFLLTLHRAGVFLALDSLADTFARGLPWLLLVGCGWWVLSSQSAESKGSASTASLLRQVGQGLVVAGVALFLFAVGLLPALAALARTLIAQPGLLGLLVGTVLFGTATWFWWQAGTGLLFNATIGQTEMLSGYLLLSPNLLGFGIFFAGPLLFSLYVSFTEWSAFGSPDWIGVANYREILGLDFASLAHPAQRANEVLAPRFIELTRVSLLGNSYVVGAQDKLFWIALRNTFTFALMVVPLSVLPALVLANILNSKIPGMRFFRALYFLPSVAAVVGIAVIWNWLYNSTVGFINYGITQLVTLLNTLPGAMLVDPQIRWLSNSDTALFAIVIMSAWRIVGFNTVLFLAGLQGIPKDIYEAAEVDGSDRWRTFISITVPLLGPTTFFVTTTTIIQALQLFDEVFVLMNPPAGPNNATLSAVLYLYQNGFQRFNLGYASAVAWTLFIVIFLVTLVQFRIQRTSSAVD